MRLTATRRISPGCVLARDVYSGTASDRPLLRAGVVMTDRYLRALIESGHNAVYVEDELSEGIVATPALTARTREQASVSLNRALGSLSAGGGAGRRLEPHAFEELTRVAGLIAAEIASTGEAVVAFSDLAAADSYTLQHSIEVCAIGLLLAKRLFREQGRIDYRGSRVWSDLEPWLAKLGVGLLLHDVGKVAIPAAVLNKPGELEPEEWEVVRRHPLVGLELLASDLISPLVKTVVRSHHERWDGTGYPHGIAGTAIPQFARIAAVADVFDAVTSERPYRAAAPQHVGHAVVNGGAATQFDAELVDVFNRVVAPWPPGDEIELTDGRRGVVVSCPPTALARPLVRVGFDASGACIEPEVVSLLDREDLVPPTALAVAA